MSTVFFHLTNISSQYNMCCHVWYHLTRHLQVEESVTRTESWNILNRVDVLSGGECILPFSWNELHLPPSEMMDWRLGQGLSGLSKTRTVIHKPSTEDREARVCAGGAGNSALWWRFIVLFQWSFISTTTWSCCWIQMPPRYFRTSCYEEKW